MIPRKTIGRLSLYRRLLSDQMKLGAKYIYSHELAGLAGVTAAQVRRDIMHIGFSGNPNRGYDIPELSSSIGRFIDDPSGQFAALVGVGNLGRAIMSYFSGRRPKLAIAAAFDNDPAKYGRVIHGYRCHSIEELASVVKTKNISIGIITVPASEAQKTADMLVALGVKGILNFAPVPLKVPAGVHVEDIDMTMSLETVAYFARKASGKGK
jgi:redox-sensing transcriptional repressor